MKKILTFAGIAFMLVLLSAPSFVKADDYVIGSVYIHVNSGQNAGDYNIPIYTTVSVSPQYVNIRSGGYVYVYENSSFSPAYQVYYTAPWNNQRTPLYQDVLSGYIGGIVEDYSWTFNSVTRHFYGDLDDYFDSLPEDLRPEEPTWIQRMWLDFYDFLEFQLGLDPFDGGIWNLFKRYFDEPENESLEIVFPTNTPSPTPTPRPTPIPVQTIYVPDGNGSYTIIYQYPDPSGTITQSPYNPNIDVNVEVDCDCDGGSKDYYPQDPMYAPLEGLSWSSVSGDLTGSPAMSASQSLDAIKAEVDSYDEPIKVVSNSFGALPSKWLGLVGLLGACLIVAGLIRTFLGG